MTELGSPPAESLSHEFHIVAGQDLRGVTPTGLRRLVSLEGDGLLPVADVTAPTTPDLKAPAPAPPGAPEKRMSDRNETYYYQRYAKNDNAQMTELGSAPAESLSHEFLTVAGQDLRGVNKRPKHGHFGVG